MMWTRGADADIDAAFSLLEYNTVSGTNKRKLLLLREPQLNWAGWMR